MEIMIYSEQDMQRLGVCLGPLLESGDVVYLRGTLGAGKTTLVRGIARGLGYKGRVTSPTFTIMNIYPTSPPIYHFDFYRLMDNELDDLGLDDYLEREGIALIEWPPSAGEVLPGDALTVEIELQDEDYDRERRLYISARGVRYEEKRERLMELVDSGS
jgi:tRNA threonylcarbamoyladenosine biosynthesis protein TsaE